MIAEVAHSQIREQVARRLREQYLPAVACRHHPGYQVQVDADVALLGAGRLAVSIPSAPAPTFASTSAVRPRPRQPRPTRARTRTEGAGCVSTSRRSFDANPLPDQPPVLREYHFVLGSELRKQARRGLNVRKEERDGARGRFRSTSP